MEFFFDERRAAQAASLLLERHAGRMPYIKLIKLLYLADREALIETGVPITGDRFVSMKLGPVLVRVFDLIKEPSPAEDSVWHSYVAREHFDAVLVGSAESDHLSEYDEGVLREIFDSCGHEKWPFVVARTHALPEWTDPGKSSIPIEPEDILRYAGFSDEEIEAAAAQARATYKLRTHMAAAG